MSGIDYSYPDDALEPMPTECYAAPQAAVLDTTWLNFMLANNALDFKSGCDGLVTTDSTIYLPVTDFAEPLDSINPYPSPPDTASNDKESSNSQPTPSEFVARSTSEKHGRQTSTDRASYEAAAKDNNRPYRRRVGKTTVEKEPIISRDRVRAHNRAAATRFRDKKRAYKDDLQERMSNSETKCHELNTELSDLKEKVYQLKVLLMAHGGCNDNNIDLWMKVEVHKFVDREVQEQALASASDVL